MIFIALFQQFGSETTKKQSSGGGACLVSLRSNIGTPQAATRKRQSPVGKETSLKVLSFTLLSLRILDYQSQPPKWFESSESKDISVNALCRKLGAITQCTSRSTQCGAILHGDLAWILEAGETYLVLSKLSYVQEKSNYSWEKRCWGSIKGHHNCNTVLKNMQL